MKIRKGDKVKVIMGKDKGVVAEVLRVLNKKNKVIVSGVNKVKKHVKPGQLNPEGGIVEFEKPIDVSNVMHFDEKAGKVARVGYKFIDGKKYRISKKTGEVLDLRDK